MIFGQRVKPGALAGFNLLFVTLDTVRMDHVGCYGFTDARTPTIDALAERGVLFAHAVTANPSTLPSHTTMMTGLEAPSHGVRANGKFTLQDGFTTLAEVLKGQGYATAAFISSWVLRSRTGLSQGFDVYDEKMSSKTSRKMDGHWTALTRPADNITDASLAWLTGHLETQDPGPFFMWVHYYDAHEPYSPPEEFARLFPESPYDGEIAFIDSQLARLFGFIEAHDLQADTLIVLASDHGEGLGDHGERDHSRLIYDTTMRIPLIMSCPPVFDVPRQVDDVTVGTMDIMPTVLGLMGVTSPSKLDGIDMATTTVSRDRAIYLEALGPLLNHGWASLHGWRRVHAKYIRAPLPEYYDLAKDPDELDNLFQSEPGKSNVYAGELADYMDRWVPVEQAIGGAHSVDARAARKLASLGYLNTGGPGDAAPAERLDPKDMVPIFRALQSETPEQLHRRSCELIELPSGDQGAYRRGYILADAAVTRASDQAEYRTTLGIAEFRLGSDEAALASLVDAEQMRKSAGQDSSPRSIAFLAMTLHRLGRSNDARTELDRLRRMVQSDGITTDVAQRYLAEAEATINAQ